MNYLAIGVLGAVAAAIVYNHNTKDSSDNADFKEGYIAGFLTPGPVTILALAGGFIYLNR